MNFVNFTIGGSAAAPQTWLTTILPGLTVALVAGIVLFLLNWLREWLTARWNRKSEAEVLAFSLVTEFDRLVAACSEVVDDPLHQDEHGVWDTTVKTPWIEFPEIWKWGSFPTKLQYQIRSIPNKIYLANRSVSSLWEYGDGPPDYDDAFEERRFRYAWIGLEAVLINDILAKEYGVPLLDRGEWDPEERFETEIEKISKSREEEKANPWPQPYWMLPEVPIEELTERHRKLAVDLEAAQKRQEAR